MQHLIRSWKTTQGVSYDIENKEDSLEISAAELQKFTYKIKLERKIHVFSPPCTSLYVCSLTRPGFNVKQKTWKR